MKICEEARASKKEKKELFFLCLDLIPSSKKKPNKNDLHAVRVRADTGKLIKDHPFV